MRCIKCGQSNPDDSLFCQYCGEPIPKQETVVENNNIDDKNLSQTIHPMIEPKQLGNNFKQKKFFSVQLLTIGILLVALIASFIWGFNCNNKYLAAEEKDNLLIAENDGLKSQYDTIINFLKSPDAGYSMNGFCASKAVVIVEQGKSETFTLTTNAFDGVQIQTSLDNENAAMDFAATNWEDNVQIKITGNTTGNTIITFGNNQNDKSFRVMVVVI